MSEGGRHERWCCRVGPKKSQGSSMIEQDARPETLSRYSRQKQNEPERARDRAWTATGERGDGEGSA